MPFGFGSEHVTGDLGKASFWEVAWVGAALDLVQEVFLPRETEYLWCTLGAERGRGGLPLLEGMCIS